MNQTNNAIKMTEYWTTTAAASTKTPVIIYSTDGSKYEGCVNMFGEKHGFGCFKTNKTISGVVGEVDSHMTTWTEFEGEWQNNLLHGMGVMRTMSDRGMIKIVYNCRWDNGVPVPAK